METIYFPVACTIAFAHSGIRKIAAKSLHPFKVQELGSKTVNLTAPDGTIAYGVLGDYFERLPAGYTWAKFKNGATLAWAKRGLNCLWNWQPDTIRFEPDRFYAIKVRPTDYDPGGKTSDCDIVTKDGKIYPYVSRKQFSVFSENSQPAQTRVLEAFPLPVPGNRSANGFWESPSEYDSIPVVLERHVDGCYKSSTVSPVAALRLDFDADRNPVYKCSYFGPANKIKL